MVTKVPVVTPDDLGRGIKKNESAKKFEVDLTELVDGTTISYVGGKLVGQSGSSGLDCSAIGTLKKEKMTKTTTVLGRNADGDCVQVAVLDSIFQDVGVGISANKYSGYAGDTFNVKVTVTNTGEGTNEKTTLSIIKPALGTYSIRNQTHTSQGAGTVTKKSDTEYTITNLAKGGTVVVSFDVVSSSHGTYQFSATVDPQSALDTNSANHRATVSLNVNTKADTSYQATNDCPAIVVTDLATSKVLKNRGASGEMRTTDYNIFENPITGRKFKLQGASTVVIAKTNRVHQLERWYYKVGRDNAPSHAFSPLYGIKLSPTTLSPFENTSYVTSDYSFDPTTGVLTMSAQAGHGAIVAMRPAGNNCRWQYFSFGVLAPVRNEGCTIESAPAPTESNVSFRVGSYGFNLGTTVVERTVDTNAGLYLGEPRANGGGAVSSFVLNKSQEVTYTHKKGTAKTITVTNDTCDQVATLVSSGKVKFTPTGKNSLTITIAADATPTDSITLGRITVKIVD